MVKKGFYCDIFSFGRLFFYSWNNKSFNESRCKLCASKIGWLSKSTHFEVSWRWLGRINITVIYAGGKATINQKCELDFSGEPLLNYSLLICNNKQNNIQLLREMRSNFSSLSIFPTSTAVWKWFKRNHFTVLLQIVYNKKV